MGKKSDKFMNDIQGLIAELRDPLMDTKKAIDELQTLKDAMDKAIKQLCQAGRDGDDKAKKEASDLSQELFIKQVAIGKRGKAACQVFRTAREALKKKVAEFENYVDKKENSKNPFSSKQSIPASREFIARTAEALTETKKYATYWS